MFAGIGGFREGLTRAGDFVCVGHCEIDKHADRSYRALFDTEGEWFLDDIRKADPADLPDFDLLCGGFPCQSFSIAGSRGGFDDPRGTLFFELARLAEARHPKYWLAENVPGLLDHDGGRTFAAILREMEKLGYFVEWQVLNSADFGVPQARKRVYLIGYLDERCRGKIFPFTEGAGAPAVQPRPAEAAAQIDFTKHITANDIGLVAYLHGIIDTDTVCELVDFHSAWLWNTIESLIKANADWDLFYMHSHPIDWFYHGWLSELDSTDDAVRTKAEKMERYIYEVEDRLLGRLMDIMGDETVMCVCSDHGATPLGPILNTAHALKEAGLCSYEPKKSENYWDIYEETEGFNYVLDVSKSLAVPQRYMFVYVNLKGRYPGGIVEQEDYENVRDRIINALLDYKHPDTGDRPVLLAVRKEDAHVFGMGGAQAGDVVYVLKPEYMAEHGYGLPTGESGCGSLKNLLMFRGPNIRKGYRYTRPRWLADIVPTFCYITGNPVPADAEGAPIYQIMENPNLVD